MKASIALVLMLLLAGCVQKTVVKNCLETVDASGSKQEYSVCEKIWFK